MARCQGASRSLFPNLLQRPGEFTRFDFPPGVPAPFGMAAAILGNTTMLSPLEKLQVGVPLVPMMTGGQAYIDEQDELSVLEWMRKNGMPERMNDEVFIAMAKALDFIDPDKLSMTVILTAMNRFINETSGSRIAFLDGNQPERLCAPLREHVEARGGSVRLSAPLRRIELRPDGSVAGLRLAGSADGSPGELVQADAYVSALPVDALKLLLPEPWRAVPFFAQLGELEGIPVINLHLWFDRKLTAPDNLCFSRSPLLSVYADMSATCREYADPDRSMLELVFAPCSPLAGSDVNWIGKSDEEIIEATMRELERLFPTEIAADGSKARASGSRPPTLHFPASRLSPPAAHPAVRATIWNRPSPLACLCLELPSSLLSSACSPVAGEAAQVRRRQDAPLRVRCDSRAE